MRKAGRWWPLLIGMVIVTYVGAAHGASSESVRVSASSVGQYEKLELTVPLSTVYTNPFDPREVEVTGRFSSPSGQTILVPGFYVQDYARSRTADGAEALAPVGDGVFKVRFAWGAVGRYRYAVTVKDRAGTRTRGRGRVHRARLRRSRLRAAEPDAPYFQCDSGASYFAIGENMCWPGRGGTYDYDLWLNKLADAGGNYPRLWLVNDWNPLGLEKRAQAPG